MLALYHLLRGRAPFDKLAGVSDLLKAAGIARPPSARVAVVVGTAINPTRERRPANLPGIAIRTLWGEIAAQLAEQAGDPKLFNRVRSADRKGVPPGSDALRGLFDACGPCLILIDELVAYARKIYGVDGLPAGTFDAVQTFIQELTEAVRASRNTVLVATIPESDIEIGGDRGPGDSRADRAHVRAHGGGVEAGGLGRGVRGRPPPPLPAHRRRARARRGVPRVQHAVPGERCRLPRGVPGRVAIWGG